MMTMIDAFTAAAGLFGLGAFGAGARPDLPAHAALADEGIRQEQAPPVPEPLAPGDPFYEAVADALRRAGYLHS